LLLRRLNCHVQPLVCQARSPHPEPAC
jgi:hypothetical protein